MTSIFNEIKEKFRSDYDNELFYDDAIKVVWDRIIELLMMGGSLIKVKGEVNLPIGILLKAVETGLSAFYNPHDIKAKQDFKDAVNFIGFYILDDYNLKELRKEDSKDDGQEF
ncbi:MAG: hypothetical protein NC218_08450 [Acetobacter sp.]|nr:hypothetical protein [Acetobacter sp.]